MTNEASNLKDIAVNFNQSIFVTDNKGKVIFANPMAEKILGIPLSKMIGSNVAQLVEEGYYDKSPVLQVLEKKQSVIDIINTKHGNKIIVSSQPLFDNHKRINMVVSSSIEQEVLHKLMSILEKEREAKNKYREEARYLRGKDLQQDKIVAKSVLMTDLILKARRIASTDSTVMLYGESGTGKDVIAKFIYSQSLRKEASFITLNCAAIPDNLLESELFGYEQGAFTGAGNKAKLGLFEIADHGTLFLDEIAELPLCLQPKLLRAIENGEVRRIGATKNRRVDVRLIGATNRNLHKMVENGDFREDLFYRLNVIPIEIPPLRARPDDVIALAEKFLNDLNIKYKLNKTFGPQIIELLINYNWPGNVRELKNIVERLFIITHGQEINSYDGAVILPKRKENVSPVNTSLSSHKNLFNSDKQLKEFLTDMEKQYIEQVVQECNGSINKAADQLGIHRSVLYRKRKAFNTI